jgi:hypothetical protein
MAMPLMPLRLGEKDREKREVEEGKKERTMDLGRMAG